MRRLFFFLILTLLLSSFAHGALEDGLKAYYNLDSATNLSDYTRQQPDAFNGGANFITSAKVNGGFNCTASESDWIDLGAGFKETYTSLAFGGWFYKKSASDEDFAFDGHNGANQGFFIRYDTNIDCVIGGGGSEAVVSVPYRDTTWQFIICNWNGTSLEIWSDGTKNASTAKTTYTPNSKNTSLCAYPGYLLFWNGAIDQPFFYNRSLSSAEISQLYNNSYGLYAPWNSTPPNLAPVIDGIVQTPTNATILSVVNQSLNVSANITDTDLNISTIRLELITNNTLRYVNGTLYATSGNKSYSSNSSNTYKFTLDENDLISSSAMVDTEIFENTTHDSAVLSNANQYVKMMFLNISGTKQYSFYEIYDENNTNSATATYYYCNSSYISGNPTINSNCALFASIPNDSPFSHTHIGGKSKHRVISLGVDPITQTIGGVKITSLSYILKRGTIQGERYYYINATSRPGATQTTSNNGATWANQTYTVDAHIHEIDTNATFKYRICASDQLPQETCSAFNTDNVLEIIILPPSAVNIYEPRAQIYNNSITINHSVSVSPQGTNISNYTYYYAKYPYSSYTQIAVNPYSVTTYYWDISQRANGNYTLKIYIQDITGNNATTYSEVFQILNEETLTTQLLTSIDRRLLSIYEVLQMMAYVFLLIVNIFLVLLYRKFDKPYSFFNAVLSIILVVLFWPLSQIISYLCILTFILNSLNFYKDDYRA